MNLTIEIRITGNILLPLIIEVTDENGEPFAHFTDPDRAVDFFAKHFGVESAEYDALLHAFVEADERTLV